MDFKNCQNILEFILVLEKKSTIYVKDLHVYFASARNRGYTNLTMLGQKLFL